MDYTAEKKLVDEIYSNCIVRDENKEYEDFVRVPTLNGEVKFSKYILNKFSTKIEELIKSVIFSGYQFTDVQTLKTIISIIKIQDRYIDKETIINLVYLGIGLGRFKLHFDEEYFRMNPLELYSIKI